MDKFTRIRYGKNKSGLPEGTLVRITVKPEGFEHIHGAVGRITAPVAPGCDIGAVAGLDLVEPVDFDGTPKWFVNVWPGEFEIVSE